MTRTVVRILLVAFTISFLAAGGGSVHAQSRRTQDPFQQFNEKVKQDFTAANNQAKAVVNGTSTDPEVSCDFHMFVLLTPQNLESVMKKCSSDIHSTLADDTQRALDSAIAYPDNDGVACLKPGLAIVKAGIQTPAIPAVPEVPAVLNTDGTVKTPAIPAVAAVPAKDPGIVLLFQKYREFTLSGALTSCQTWINGPLQATIAAAASAAGNGIALGTAAVAIAPKVP